MEKFVELYRFRPANGGLANLYRVGDSTDPVDDGKIVQVLDIKQPERIYANIQLQIHRGLTETEFVLTSATLESINTWWIDKPLKGTHLMLLRFDLSNLD